MANRTSTRRTRRPSLDVRRRLVEAALVEFAIHGFEGASTRAIAARADAHQPQINYHFESKDELWRAVFDNLMDELDAAIAAPDAASPIELLAETIRGLVRFAAERPELNRIMTHEGTADSERLRWLVERHLEHRHRALVALWETVSETDAVAPINPALIYHMLVGASSLMYSVAPEARLLVDIEPTDPDVVAEHAETLVNLFIPGLAAQRQREAKQQATARNAHR